MLKFRLMGMPIGIDWWFWLICVLLGGGLSARNPQDWLEVGLWTLVVFVSIMVHELGHALAGRRFGARPAIRLHGFGGTTYLPGGQFTRGQSILVSAAGPLAGLLLGMLILAFDVVVGDKPRELRLLVRFGLYVNFFWTFINLLPIQPLDGGQILRDVLGPSRLRVTALVGFGCAVAMCYWSFTQGMIFLAFMLAFLAYHNFRMEPMDGGVIKQ